MSSAQLAGLVIAALVIAAVLWIRGRGLSRLMTWPFNVLVAGLLAIAVLLISGW